MEWSMDETHNLCHRFGGIEFPRLGNSCSIGVPARAVARGKQGVAHVLRHGSG